MKGTSRLPETLVNSQAGLAETDNVMRTGRLADSIRALAAGITVNEDAGYMAATSPSTKQRGFSCIAGRTIYE
jgi:hypothetical protein